MTSTTHCWVCDGHGDLFVLKNVSIHADYHVDHQINWVQIDSGFKSIYAGHRGLVCGIKNCSLYVRKCVNHVTPVGTEWIVYACDVLKVMPGTSCIVRKSSKGCLLAAGVDLEAQVLDWKPIPESREGDSEEVYHIMDDCDRLFTITGIGAVSCCEPLTRDPYWYTVAAPPPNLGSGQGIISKLLNYWSVNGNGNNSRDWVGMVSFGAGCIWCLKEDTGEVWQLVIGWVNSAPKANWALVELPLSEGESVVSLSAAKPARRSLFVIIKGEGYFKMMACSFESAAEGCSKVEIELPVKYPCWSMAICSTPTTSGNEFNHVSRKRGALPALPAGENIPMSKRAREEGEGGGVEEEEDHHNCLHNGVEITCNTTIPTDKFETDVFEVPSIETIQEEFQYDFSMEHEIIHEWYQWNTR